MIGIVILNYNTWHETEECVLSIFQNEKESDYHIYLVDNASITPMTEKMKSIILNKKITYLQSEINRGYSTGNNIGVQQAITDKCDEILISNNDIYFKKDSITNMKKYLEINPKVGIVGPKVLLQDGSLQMINMGVKTGIKEKYKYLLRKTPFKFMVKDFLVKFSALDQDLTKPFEVHSVSGCCFMMSKKCTLDITPFDENTFLYEEERIIGIVMEKLGYKTIYFPGSEVIHAHGRSTQDIKAFSYTCLVESEIYYCKEYLKASKLKILPLYFIRTLQYLFLSFRFIDYRKQIKKYLSITLKRLYN